MLVHPEIDPIAFAIGPLAVVALGVGIVAALLPAWRAYRNYVSRTLAQR
jgi:prolipoprotein diacylglyceryltransferase